MDKQLNKLIEWVIDKAFAHGITSAGIGNQDYNNGDIKRVASNKAHQLLLEAYELGRTHGEWDEDARTDFTNPYKSRLQSELPKQSDDPFWNEIANLQDEINFENKANALVNRTINNLETITYHKHHYVRKTGLKKIVKKLVHELHKKELPKREVK